MNRQIKPKFIILSGDGINCERETSFAFHNAGAQASIVHINDLLKAPSKLKDFQGMALPGGFSFGDELGSGQILALKIKHGLTEEFADFVNNQKPIIGICNGFQVLVKLGLLPFPLERRVMALAPNESGQFINRWTNLSINRQSICKWTTLLKDHETIKLPIRHGEGRVIFLKENKKDIYNNLLQRGQIPFSYSTDVNGSYKNIASICDPSGTILGMMPHPEAYLYQITSIDLPNNSLTKGIGQLFFESIVQYVNQT